MRVVRALALCTKLRNVFLIAGALFDCVRRDGHLLLPGPHLIMSRVIMFVSARMNIPVSLFMVLKFLIKRETGLELSIGSIRVMLLVLAMASALLKHLEVSALLTVSLNLVSPSTLLLVVPPVVILIVRVILLCTVLLSTTVLPAKYCPVIHRPLDECTRMTLNVGKRLHSGIPAKVLFLTCVGNTRGDECGQCL